MAIPETQLETWSHQGSVTQSAETYNAIKTALEDPRAPYAAKNFDVFLQGSYANSTNIYADSDVDVVICLNSTYYYDESNLSDFERAARKLDFSPSTYSYDEFKKEVLSWLKYCFGTGVIEGNKAIFIPANGQRREADVLVSAQFRNYTSYSSIYAHKYHLGITFWTKSGTQIVNYPQIHFDNGKEKHQATTSRFKPSVRILKNLRNRMVVEGVLPDGLAPSYFLEGMLYNVPNATFVHSRVSTIAGSLNWLNESNREELVCVNEIYLLLHPTSSVTWRKPSFETYLRSTIDYWNNW